MIVSVSEDKSLKVWPLCQDSAEKVSIKSSLHSVSAHIKTINAVRVSPK